MTWVRRYHVLYARSMQTFSGKNMKRTNGVRAASGAFLIPSLQLDFGCTVVFNTLKDAYPQPSIVLCRRSLATFAEVLIP